MDNLKIPYVAKDLVDYLFEVYDFDYMLSCTEGESSDYQIGYIRGIRDLIGHLRAIQEEQDEVK